MMTRCFLPQPKLLCMLRELIKAVYVEAPDKSSGKCRQNIHIQYDGIGFIPLEELAKKETA